MFVPLWLLGGLFILTALLALVVIRKTGADDMISQQRRDTPPPPPPARPPIVDEQALMALPEVVAALERGNKIEAIKHVRLASGLGLKAAKDLVERQSAR